MPKLRSHKNVIAIDPGYDRIGIAIFSDKELVHSECFIPDTKIFTERILLIKNRIQSLVKKYEPGALALETLFFSNNQKTALHVAEARGVILIAGVECGLSIYEYSPQEVKIAVTGSGNADKKAVGFMVGKLMRLEKKKRLDDEIDALAVGIAHYANLKSKQR